MLARRFCLLRLREMAAAEARGWDWPGPLQAQQHPSRDHWRRSRVQAPRIELASPARLRPTLSRGSPIGEDAEIHKSRRQLYLRLHLPFRSLEDFDRSM